MNDVHTSFRGRGGKTDLRPAEIRRRVQRFIHMNHAANRARRSAEGDDLERLAKREESGHELMDVTAHAGGR